MSLLALLEHETEEALSVPGRWNKSRQSQTAAKTNDLKRGFTTY